MANYLAFSDLYTELERIIKSTKGAKRNLCKQIINQVYLNEILRCDSQHPLFWLLRMDDSLRSIEASNISGITAATPAVVTTSAAHGLTAGDIVMLHNISGMTELNGRMFKVGTVGATTTFQLLDLDGNNIDSSGYTAYTSGGDVSHHGLTLATTKYIDCILLCNWFQDGQFEGVMDPVGIPDLNDCKNQDFWNDDTSLPDRYMHRQTHSSAGARLDQLLWFDGANEVYNLRYWYSIFGDRLSSDTDVPLLPFQFHDTIISGSAARLAEYNVQVENAVIWPGLYAGQLEAIRDFNAEWWKSHDIKGRIDFGLL